VGKTIAQNRRARFEYEILDRFEAGIALVGSEVKSLREGRGSLADAYAVIEGGEAFVCKLHVDLYEPANRFNHDPTRRRKLLLHKRELKRLIGRVSERGLTLVPLSLYFNDRGFVKLSLGLARGKKLYDKREAMKERTARREMERAYVRRDE
jgi:SsrA-binding protein